VSPRRAWRLAATALLWGAPLQAQSTTDVLTGRVTAPNREPVAGARVTATSLASGLARTARSDEAGKYTLVFPDGGGAYRLRVTALGMTPFAADVRRVGDRTMLVTDVRLDVAAVVLDEVHVRVPRRAPGRGEAGSAGRGLSGDLIRLLPGTETDPGAVVRLTPGVVTGGSGDSLGVYSVAGQRTAFNQTTLDGASVSSGLTGGSSVALPAEALRAVSVVTSTYDVARGQFSGGQLAMVTRSGTNDGRGALSAIFGHSPAAGLADRWNNDASLFRFSGGAGGPIIRDKLFYFVSGAGQWRRDEQSSLLLSTRAASAIRTSPDSIARFLDILQRVHGFSSAGQTGAFQRTNDAISGLARIDWSIGDRHTLALRLHASSSRQNNVRIGPLDLRSHGGTGKSDVRAAIATLTSQIGNAWVNDLRLSALRDNRHADPFLTMPEGRVRVVSGSAGSAANIALLSFGADRFLPRSTHEESIEVNEELSGLVGSSHRMKLGVQVSRRSFSQAITSNRFGVFEYSSLEDLEAARPASYTRVLAERPPVGSVTDVAIYLGDSWRSGPLFQMTYGARLEATQYGVTPVRAPNVDLLFGRRSTRMTEGFHASPRLGFTARLARSGAGANRFVRGGIGEFRARMPLALYAAVLDQTGDESGHATLTCIGDDVPVPNWEAYARDPALIPSTCRPTELQASPPPPTPALSLFAPGFQAPRAWRASLGFETPLYHALQGSVDVSYARGVHLYGTRDLNLDARSATPLRDEGRRPLFVDPSTVSPATAAVSAVYSRRNGALGTVLETSSSLGSEAMQVQLAINGILPPRVFFQAAYALSHARDQSSFSCCTPEQSFASPTTSGDPNRLEWGTSDLDRRHIFTAMAAFPVLANLDLTLVGRAMSGAPFTPRVAGDINGDGFANDRAFIFEPGRSDPAIGAALQELLQTAPANVRNCLRSQLGRIAGRNSCRGSWFNSLDVRATYKPRVGGARRATVSLDATNVLAALDRLVHGSDGIRGWGQYEIPDVNLLYPRAFDPSGPRFVYEVNSAFGTPLNRRLGFGTPFQLQLSVRITLGATSEPLGAFSSLAYGGARGGGGGEGRGGAPPDFSAILDQIFDNPLGDILAVRDSIRLDDAQAATIRTMADSLDARLISIKTSGLAKLKAAGDDMTAFMSVMGPVIRDGRLSIQGAVEQVRKLLTDEQWRRVPESARSALSGGPYRVSPER
jgi:carboxypeptidase family protein